MKNNRRIEVGQVRQINSSYPEELYHIVNFRGNFVEVVMLTGEEKGDRHRWFISSTKEDIVVM